MPGIDAKIIQNLMERIEAFQKILDPASDEGQITKKNINYGDVLKEIPRTADGTLEKKRWDALGQEKQRELHARLNIVFEDLKAAAGPGASKQPCDWGAALIATSILLPGAATFFTLIIMLVFPGATTPFMLLCMHFEWSPDYSPLLGMLAACIVWPALGTLYCKFTDAEHAIPTSFDELVPRLDELEIDLKCFADSSKNPRKNNAYFEALKEYIEIKKELTKKGHAWVLATGYSKVWRRLYNAEEAMIEVAPQKKALEGAYYDEARLEGSDIKNRDDLLSKLRKAVVSIDPSAHKYLKSTAAVASPPALAIGTTALSGGQIAVEYFTQLLATGGVPPYKWAVIGGAIPEGLIFSPQGVLRGTPRSDGRGNFTIQVTDSAGVTLEKYFDLMISPLAATPSPLTFSSTSPLPWGTVDEEYNEPLFVTGGTPPYQWRFIDPHPEGLDLSSEGLLHGRPAKDNIFRFSVEVADSNGKNPIQREFTLHIKPSGATAEIPADTSESEMLARTVLRHVRNSINEYRNTRWNGLILARNRLLATFMLTGTIVFSLLTIAIMSGAEKSAIVAAAIFYLVGGTAGLCNRLRNESNVEMAIPDYGLSAARLITLPLFSGLAAMGGLVFVAYLPYATPVFAPDLSNLPVAGITETAAVKAPAAAPAEPATSKTQAAPSEKAAAKTTPDKAAAKTAVQKAAHKTPSAAMSEKAVAKTAADKAPMQRAPKLKEIFNFEINLIGLFVALVFGMMPGLLFERLQQQADRYKTDLKSSKSSEGT